MKCSPLARLGLMLGFVALMASVPALADGPAVSCPPPVKHRVAVRQHRWVHHYVYVARPRYLVAWTPACGGVEHPCNVDHLTVPIQ
jgi:hypothetical protein